MEEVSLVSNMFGIIISDFPEVMVTKSSQKQDLPPTRDIGIHDHGLLGAYNLIFASEGNSLCGDRAHLPCKIKKLSCAQSCSSPHTLPKGFGPIGCPPRYLHIHSDTDPEKLLVSTSTVSMGKRS